MPRDALPFSEGPAARRGAARALAAAGRMVAQEPDDAVVAQRIVDTVRALFDSTSARLLRRHPDSGDLESIAVSGAVTSGFGDKVVFPAGTGVVGAAMRARRPIASADFLSEPGIRHDPDILSRLQDSPNRAVLAIPIVLQERPIGVLAVANRTGWTVGAEDIELAQAFADLAALALDNARLYAEARRREREAEELARVARMLTETLDVADVGRRIVESVAPLLGGTSARLRLLEADGRLSALAWAGAVPRYTGCDRPLPPGIGLTGLALASGKPQWTPDVLADSAVRLDDEIRRACLESGDRAYLAVPLQVKGTIIGSLTIGDRPGRVFTDREMVLAQAFGDQAALALENARLHQAAVRRQEELTALLRATRALMTGLDQETMLRTILEEAAEIAATPYLKVLLVDREAGVLRVGAQMRELMPPEGTMPLGGGYSGKVAVSGQPMYVADTRHDPTNLLAARGRELGILSYLGLPITIRDEVLGVLSINTTHPREYSAEELAYLGSFADQAALALDNARLYRDLTRKTEHLQALFETLAHTQDQLVQSQKMEAIGRLAGGIAHDFNNLLTVVTGRAFLLRARLGGDQTAARHLEKIVTTAERATALTRRLLTFSRTQVLQPVALDLNALVAGTRATLERLLGRDVTLATRLDPALGAVRADPAHIEQVLGNLVANAREAMPAGGTVTIETANFEPAGAAADAHGLEPGRYVTLVVRDTGVGMDAPTRARAFEPFFTTKDRGRNMGLGLATAYAIVQQSDGAIWVQSEPGEGAAITICLPRLEPAAPAAPGTTPAAGGTETILLVDDEDDVRLLAREILEEAGYRVIEARGGLEALGVHADHAGALHLLLTDVIMPDMSGPRVAEALTRAQPDLRVLFMSGYTDGALGRHGRLDPGTAFLQKPFSPAALVARVRDVLGARS